MAAPITHIVLADKVFSKYFPGLSKAKFFIGTSFPDIRYLRIIGREITHFINPTLNDIRKENDVKAGMVFHSFVDEIRETFMENNGLYNLISRTANSMRSIKLLEDEVFYAKIPDWNQIASMMDSVTPEELEYPIKKEDIVRWHNILKDYFIEKPNPETRVKFFQALSFNNEVAQEIEEGITKMRSDKKIIEIINNFYNKFGENT